MDGNVDDNDQVIMIKMMVGILTMIMEKMIMMGALEVLSLTWMLMMMKVIRY